MKILVFLLILLIVPLHDSSAQYNKIGLSVSRFTSDFRSENLRTTFLTEVTLEFSDSISTVNSYSSTLITMKYYTLKDFDGKPQQHLALMFGLSKPFEFLRLAFGFGTNIVISDLEATSDYCLAAFGEIGARAKNIEVKIGFQLAGGSISGYGVPGFKSYRYIGAGYFFRL